MHIVRDSAVAFVAALTTLLLPACSSQAPVGTTSQAVTVGDAGQPCCGNVQASCHVDNDCCSGLCNLGTNTCGCAINIQNDNGADLGTFCATAADCCDSNATCAVAASIPDNAKHCQGH